MGHGETRLPVFIQIRSGRQRQVAERILLYPVPAA